MDIKKEFEVYFRRELNNSYILQVIIYEIFVKGTAYIIGGYFRDFLTNRTPRDLDILADVPHSYLLQVLDDNKIEYVVNRHNGIKVKLEEKSLDIWTVENNWAFKEDLVKLSDYDKLNSIAQGCFYNYDALVINLHEFNYNLRHYKKFMEDKILDIFYSSSEYMILNKTVEANILRAFYIKKTYNASFSDRTRVYLINKIGELKDMNGFPLQSLYRTLDKYPKYKSIIKMRDLASYIKEVYIAENNINNQLYLDF